MNILIATDKFKGTLTSIEAAEIMKSAILSVNPSFNVDFVPIADGGEGTLEVLTDAFKGEMYSTEVHDPLMRKITANYGISSDSSIGYVELALASGKNLLKPVELNPFITSTYGTGELISSVIKHGVKYVIIGMGGSATNDMGYGLMKALGLEVYDKYGNLIDHGGINLLKAKEINDTKILDNYRQVKFSCICDVMTPLLGNNGATYMFAKQKGASISMIEKLEEALQYFAELIKKNCGVDVTNVLGTGSAGGTTASLFAFFNAEIKRGIEYISSIMNLEEKIKKYDLIITGEGRVDKQTLQGKVPFGMTEFGCKYNIPVIAFCGSCTLTEKEIEDSNFTRIIPISCSSKQISSYYQKTKTQLYNKVVEVFSSKNFLKCILIK